MSFITSYNKFMNNQSAEIKKFLLENISKNPGNIVAISAKRFSVTGTTIHRHLNKLIKEKKIIKSGTTRATKYFLASDFNKELFCKITKNLSEFDVWQNYLHQAFSILPENVLTICHYGFTEMFNNAIDHSEGTHIIVKTEWLKEEENAVISMKIIDDGIGVFRKLSKKFLFEDLREGALALSKGKFTTDPKNHTGEGIFFTSKAFDKFYTHANGIAYFVDNKTGDWFVNTEGKAPKGTYVHLRIDVNSQQNLVRIFKKFQNHETLAFNKTYFLVKLSKFNEEDFISRSQAKRILFGLERFKNITLDFKDVKIVGQGFVDEVFRVFKNNYPAIDIKYINANKDILFMIKRSIATTAKTSPENHDS